jgi:ribosomal protein S18 acetylase RimI-like enzyme
LPAPPHVANLRAARPDQTETVLALNAAAFGPFWRYDQRTVLFWVMTADRVMLAEQGGRALGFALTTLNTTDGYAQLIRVATHPASRRQGIGRQLVADAIHYAADVGAAGVSLNTQDSNTASQRLYEALGFRPTSGALSVMVRRS